MGEHSRWKEGCERRQKVGKFWAFGEVNWYHLESAVWQRDLVDE